MKRIKNSVVTQRFNTRVTTMKYFTVAQTFGLGYLLLWIPAIAMEFSAQCIMSM